MQRFLYEITKLATCKILAEIKFIEDDGFEPILISSKVLTSNEEASIWCDDELSRIIEGKGIWD